MNNEIIDLKYCNKLDKKDVGGKAFALSELINMGVKVPEGFCITNNYFQSILSKSGIKTKIYNILQEINKNPIIINKKLEEIRNVIQNIIFKKEDLEILDRIQKQLGGRVIVRSSSPFEDGYAKSFAGVFYSEGSLENVTSLTKAIKLTWASLFTEKSYFYMGTNIVPKMSIVIQRYVVSSMGGILFTENPNSNKKEIYLEYKHGNNEEITEGRIGGKTVILTPGKPEKDFGIKLIDEIVNNCNKIEGFMKVPVDIEWGIEDEEFTVFQVRPITKSIRKSSTFAFIQQENINEVYKLNLGECEQLFVRQLQKHIWFRKICIEKKIPIYMVYYLVFRPEEIQRSADMILQKIKTEDCIIRWGKESKVVKTTEIIKALREVIKNNWNSIDSGYYCIQVGEKIPALITGIASLLPDNSLLVEAIPANTHNGKNGHIKPTKYMLAESKEILLKDEKSFNFNSDKEEYEYKGNTKLKVKYENLIDLYTICTKLRVLGETRIEWYISNNIVYVKDLSIESNHLPIPQGDTKWISHGSVYGKIYKIDNIDAFNELSQIANISVVNYNLDSTVFDNSYIVNSVKEYVEKYKTVIIAAEYPSIGLITLIPYVKGMIFKEGSILCHTAIVLREKGIPAVILEDNLYNNIKTDDNMNLQDDRISLVPN